MLSHLKPSIMSSYGYRFLDGPNHIAQIWSVGWEKRTSTSYYWDGLKRKEHGKCIFQYTLSGSGVIEVGEETFRLQPGQAFFVSIPSDHRYYLPEDSEHWEFIFIMLHGAEALNSWTYIKNALGPIVEMDPESSLIHTLLKIYNLAIDNKIVDVYQASSLAYQFIMELYRSSQRSENRGEAMPIPVIKALEFIKNSYAEPIGLEEIAQASSLSKYHFGRKFQSSTGLTPVQYLTKIRIENAIHLLRYTKYTTEQVATKVGYSNGNYFCKVFRSFVGISPQEFRSGKEFAPVEHIMID